MPLPSPQPPPLFRALALAWAGVLVAGGGLAAQTPPAAVMDPGSATLLPGDQLQVEIWREEDLSGTFTVDEDGVVTLPLLGRTEVEGRSIRELRERLIQEYQVQLRNPSITITHLRRIHVLGEVNEPGLFSVDPTVSLAGVVALAGGATPEGDLTKLRVMRDGRDLELDVGPETNLLSVGVRSGDQIFVGRRSWIDRNSSLLLSASVGVAGIFVALLRR